MIVVAILISSRFVCKFLAQNMVLKSFWLHCMCRRSLFKTSNQTRRTWNSYKRMFNITQLILKTIGPASGNVMFVGHAATLEACTRQLVGAQPRTAQELTKIVQKIPYCGLCVCQESEFGKNSTWDFIDPPIPPLTHAPNIRFDWRCLQ